MQAQKVAQARVPAWQQPASGSQPAAAAAVATAPPVGNLYFRDRSRSRNRSRGGRWLAGWPAAVKKMAPVVKEVAPV